jgi:biotin transport system substrate-specific component
MTTTTLSSLHRLVWVALLAALIAVGAYLHVPFAPVPFSLQTLFVMLAGHLLGPWAGMGAVGLYLAAGFAGLPVFAGGAAGVAHLLGPTGGFLAGFLILAGLCGLGRPRREAPGLVRPALFGLAGLAGMYLPGVLVLKYVLQVDYAKALALGFVPFIWGDLVKLGASVAAARYLHRRGLIER